MAGASVFVGKAIAAYALGRIAQSLLTKSPERSGYSEDLLGLPVGNTDSGAPRVWAIGPRVRVPAQVMWQAKKTRRPSGSPKKGGAGQIRHVTFDCAFMLNDRPTSRLMQFIVNDQLLLWSPDARNLVSVETSAMTAVASGGQVILTMDSLVEDDFSDVFEVGDAIELFNFVTLTGGNTLNTGIWKVAAVTGHSTTPSTLTLDIYSDQTIAGGTWSAGNVFAPAKVVRIDDRIIGHGWPLFQVPAVNQTNISDTGIPPTSSVEWDLVLAVPETIELVGGFSPQVTGTAMQAVTAGPINVRVTPQYSGTVGTSTNAAIIRPETPRSVASGFFPQTFIPLQHFFGGTETQTESSIISLHEGPGQVGGFRGTAYQVFDDFDVTNFGGALPPMTEALIQVDTTMDWATALREVAVRGGLDASQVDTEGVTGRPFRGYYIRGPVSGMKALMPLLIAGQIATQERQGRLAFFNIANADVVAIQNGPVFSDFGAQVDRAILEKWRWQDIDPRDLPSTVGVHFMDPGAGYGANYEQFARRFPNVGGDQNNEDLDLRTLALSRREARNLAATVARRAHINALSVSFSLPASYLHVLENDLLTWTDDEGTDHVVRVTNRQIGANFIVQIEAVRERVGLEVVGSPVQSGAGLRISPPSMHTDVIALAFDCPPIIDAWGLTPGFHVVAAAAPGSSWGGASVYVSTDGGSNYHPRGVIENEHPIGTATTALAAATPSETLGTSTLTYDTSGSIDIEFDSVGEVPIVSVTNAQVEVGWNWFAILDPANQVVEIFAARDVVQNSANSYTLSHLLRGIRGTWQGCASAHAVGVRVVGVSMLYYQSTGEFRDLAGLASPTTLRVKVVAAGGELSEAPEQDLGSRFRNVEPFPLRDITKTEGPGFASVADTADITGVTFTADNWTRTNIPPGTVGPYPLDETIERYRFTLYHQSGNGQAVYVRTKTASNTGSNTLKNASVTFTNAELTFAGYTPTPGETYWIDVQQIGDHGVSPSILQEL